MSHLLTAATRTPGETRTRPSSVSPAASRLAPPRRWCAVRQAFQALSVGCVVHVEGWCEAQLQRAAQAAIEEVQRIDAKYPRTPGGGVLCRINGLAGQAGMAVDAETHELLDMAHRHWVMSDGVFDITAGVLAGVAGGQQPLARAGWARVERGDRMVRLPAAGMALGMGAMLREYAAEQAADALLARGARCGWVLLGGVMQTLGPRSGPLLEGAAWQFELPWGLAGTGRTPNRLPLPGGALVVSAGAVRAATGQSGSRLVHPRTGRSGQHWRLVAVQAPRAMQAGMLAAVARLKGAEAPGWLNHQKVRYLAVGRDGQVLRHGLARAGPHSLTGLPLV